MVAKSKFVLLSHYGDHCIRTRHSLHVYILLGRKSRQNIVPGMLVISASLNALCDKQEMRRAIYTECHEMSDLLPLVAHSVHHTVLFIKNH